MRNASKLASILTPCLIAACGNSSRTPSESSGQMTTTMSTGSSGTDVGNDEIICMPGAQRCEDETTIATCAPTGREWLPAPCDSFQTCELCAESDPDCTTGAQCIGPCEIGEETPSSAGCSFIVSRLYHRRESFPDGVILGNPSLSKAATVQHFFIPFGTRTEEPVGPPVVLEPGDDIVIEIEEPFDDAVYTALRTGGLHRFRSDLPIIAYLQSPLDTKETNDGSMLLPVTALRQDYVATSWPAKDVMHQYVGTGEPSYFRVIAIEDNTIVEWTPPNPTGGSGFPIDFVDANQTGSVKMNRYDTVRIAASNTNPVIGERDVSGTIIHANKPIWVAAGIYCGFVRPPMQNPTCDHMQEMMIPLDHWGTKYVAVHSPLRSDTEEHIWRVFSATDDVTITATPPQPGTPISLAKRGDFAEFSVPNGSSFVLNGDKPFMPVQYLDNKDDAGGKGDPSMYQFVPVEQFLRSYVFVTGRNYPLNYVQIIREKSNADVLLDGQTVSGYEPVENYEVATVEISEGAHAASSADPFGIIQVGYSDDAENKNWSSYAYPGGMKVAEIFTP